MSFNKTKQNVCCRAPSLPSGGVGFIFRFDVFFVLYSGGFEYYGTRACHEVLRIVRFAVVLLVVGGGGVGVAFGAGGCCCYRSVGV